MSLPVPIALSSAPAGAVEIASLSPNAAQELQRALNDPTYLPTCWVGKIPAGNYCRGWNSKRFKYCKSLPGSGTNHPGQGRCSFHGGTKEGDARLTAGGRSLVKRTRIHELAEQEAERDPTDITKEINQLRGTYESFLEDYENIKNALLEWNADEAVEAKKAGRKPRPQRIADIHEAAVLIERAARVSDMLVRQQQADAVSLKELLRLMAEMARVLEHVIGKNISDERLGAQILIEVAEGWQAVRI
jgi:hypothetical protein